MKFKCSIALIFLYIIISGFICVTNASSDCYTIGSNIEVTSFEHEWDYILFGGFYDYCDITITNTGNMDGRATIIFEDQVGKELGRKEFYVSKGSTISDEFVLDSDLYTASITPRVVQHCDQEFCKAQSRPVATPYIKEDGKYYRNYTECSCYDGLCRCCIVEEEDPRPSPKISTDVDTLSIKPGETKDIVFAVSNEGTESDIESYLSLSVSSELNITGYRSSSDEMIFEHCPVGTEIWKSDGRMMNSEHELLDAYKAYASGELNIIIVTIEMKNDETTETGQQWIRYRAAFDTIGVGDNYVRTPMSGSLDQQGWPVCEIPVAVETSSEVPTINILMKDGRICFGQVSIGVIGYVAGEGVLSKVEYYIDDELVNEAIPEDKFPTSSYVWDSSTVPDGEHKIKVVGYDSSGGLAVDEVTIYVDNTVEPTINILMKDGSICFGHVSIGVTGYVAEEGVLSKVEYYIDDELVNEAIPEDKFPTSSYVWDSSTVPDGEHKIKVVGYDSSGSLAVDEVTVYVDNTVVNLLIIESMITDPADSSRKVPASSLVRETANLRYEVHTAEEINSGDINPLIFDAVLISSEDYRNLITSSTKFKEASESRNILVYSDIEGSTELWGGRASVDAYSHTITIDQTSFSNKVPVPIGYSLNLGKVGENFFWYGIAEVDETNTVNMIWIANYVHEEKYEWAGVTMLDTISGPVCIATAPVCIASGGAAIPICVAAGVSCTVKIATATSLITKDAIILNEGYIIKTPILDVDPSIKRIQMQSLSIDCNVYPEYCDDTFYGYRPSDSIKLGEFSIVSNPGTSFLMDQENLYGRGILIPPDTVQIKLGTNDIRYALSDNGNVILIETEGDMVEIIKSNGDQYILYPQSSSSLRLERYGLRGDHYSYRGSDVNFLVDNEGEVIIFN